MSSPATERVLHDEIALHTDTEVTTDPEEIIKTIESQEGKKAVRFASDIRGYYVVYSVAQNAYKLIFAGPHGPESRILDISETELKTLAKEADVIEEVDIEKSPFSGRPLN